MSVEGVYLIMSSIVREKWVWIIIGICILVMVVPYVALWMILQMPEIVRPFAVWSVIFGWGIAAGYRDWLVDAKKRGNPKSPE
jgi:hypothetical protein